MNRLEFEIIIADMLEEKGYKSEDIEKIEAFSQELHACVECAISDYCFDYGIEDYERQY